MAGPRQEDCLVLHTHTATNATSQLASTVQSRTCTGGRNARARLERRDGGEGVIKVPRVRVVVAERPVSVEADAVRHVRGLARRGVKDQVRPLALTVD